MRRPSPMLYQNEYVWLLFLSALDIMLTWVVLWHGGYEANGVAAVVLERFGLAGMVLFKFGLILLVICICESVGRRRPGTGRRLALWSIGLTCVPVMWALVLLCVHG